MLAEKMIAYNTQWKLTWMNKMDRISIRYSIAISKGRLYFVAYDQKSSSTILLGNKKIAAREISSLFLSCDYSNFGWRFWNILCNMK